MSTTTNVPRDALAAQLARLYAIERAVYDELETLATDASIDTLDEVRELECREHLQYVIDGHRDETETHLERLEQAFDALETDPRERPVPELDGLIADKEAFNNVVLNDSLRPLYYIQTVLQLEALECTCYERTIALAANLRDGLESASSEDNERAATAGDVDDVLELLETNYDDECQVRSNLESVLEGEAVETLLAANPTDTIRRTASDRS